MMSAKPFYIHADNLVTLHARPDRFGALTSALDAVRLEIQGEVRTLNWIMHEQADP